MAECIFCKIFKDKKGVCPVNDIVFEGEFFYSRFDDMAVTPGHAEIVSKRHIASVMELNNEEWGEVLELINKTIKLIEDTDLKKMYKEFLNNPGNDKIKWYVEKMLRHPGVGKKPDGYNIGINQGKAAGQTINHLHIQIIPRYFGDVEDSAGGIRNIIPGMGNYVRE